jgi:CoA:oxalate CoA-transferase
MGPLHGIRIIDFTRQLAGPFASMLLADMGAEVVKVEMPPVGDLTRNSGPYFKDGESSYFIVINRNKKSITLDLKTEAARRIVHDLVKVSDVVFDNFRPGVLERLGIEYERLSSINSQIICCSITGYGKSGPYKDKPGFDIVAQALSGGMSITGEPGRPPVRAGLPIADLTAGLLAANGIQAALLERVRTGRGQQVDTSLLAGQISLLSYMASAYWFSGVAPGPVGSGHIGNVPYRAYETRSGHMVVDGHTEKFWPLLCNAIGMPELTHDPKYKDRPARVVNRDELDGIIEQRMLQRTREEWIVTFEAAGVPCAPVNDIAETLADPHVQQSGQVIEIEHGLGWRFRAIGCPIKFSEHTEFDYRSPPTIGEHTRDILRGVLGYSPDQIDRLERAGVFGRVAAVA